MNTILRYIKIVACFFILFSCNDYLDRQPESAYMASNFYNSEAAIRQGSNGVYQRLYMHSGSIPYMTLFDMYTGMGIERDVNAGIGTGHKMASSFVWESLWADLYTSIARCNTVLDGAEPFMKELSANTKVMQYLSEIRVLRAYFYYYLINVYGDAPLFLQQVTKEDWTTATRRPVDEILPILFADIEAASEYLPWQYKEAADWGRVDKSFALGLKARLALYAGSIRANDLVKPDQAKAREYFSIAADAADRVISFSGRDLAPDYHSLFTKSGQITSLAKQENIFQIMYGGNSGDGVIKTHYISWGEYSRNIGQSGRFPTQMLVDTYEMTNGKRIDEPGSGYSPKKPFENRDSRLDHSIYKHGDICIGSKDGTSKVKFVIDVFNAKTTYYNQDGTTRLESNLDRDKNGGVSQYGFAESGVGYLWRKYNHFDDERASEPTYNYILMRFAEVLLTYAEAKIELNEIDASVYTAIDRVRMRAGQPEILLVDPTRAGNQSKMRQIVRRERKVELIGEGHHFFDMRRWRIADLENKQPTYGFPILGILDESGKPDRTKLSLNVDSYALATPDMVPYYGAAGSRADINDIPDYSKFERNLRMRDDQRYWDDAFYLSPIPLNERRKAPQITNNPGYGD